jgi:hypothetical protein
MASEPLDISLGIADENGPFPCLSVRSLPMAKLYSLSEAAGRLSLTVHAVRGAADRGTLRVERIGNMRVVTAEVVERYAREHKGRPPSGRSSMPGALVDDVRAEQLPDQLP